MANVTVPVRTANTDGYVTSSDANFATACDGPGDSVNTASGSVFVGLFGSHDVYQGFFEFDTSFIGNRTVHSATLKMKGTHTGGDLTINARLHDWGGGTLTTGDFLNASTVSSKTLLASLDTSAVTISTTDYVSLTNSGTNLKDNVNKTGTTRVVVSADFVESKTDPGSNSYVGVYSGNQSSKLDMFVLEVEIDAADPIHCWVDTDCAGPSNRGFTRGSTASGPIYRCVGFDGDGIAAGGQTEPGAGAEIGFSTTTETGDIVDIIYKNDSDWASGNPNGIIIYERQTAGALAVDGETITLVSGGATVGTTNVATNTLYGPSAGCSAADNVSDIEGFLDGQTDLAGVDIIIHLMGSAADTVVATFDFSAVTAPNSITFVGDDGTVLASTGPTNQGKNNETTFFDGTNYYSHEVSAAQSNLRFLDVEGVDIEIDGLQLKNSRAGVAYNIEFATTGAPPGNFKIRNNRLWVAQAASANSAHIYCAESGIAGACEAYNNISIHDSAGGTSEGFVFAGTNSGSLGVWNNSIYAIGTDDLGQGIDIGGGWSGNVTVKNNALFSKRTDDSAVVDNSTGTQDHSNNYVDSAGETESGWTTGLATSAWTDPSPASDADIDLTPVDGGTLDGAGTATGRPSSTDINGNAWVSDDVGALVAAVAAGSGAIGPGRGLTHSVLLDRRRLVA